MKSCRFVINISFLMCFIFGMQFCTYAGAARDEIEQEKAEEPFNAGEMIFEHILDSYQWHILTWKDKHVVVNLPIIIYNEGHLYTFSSKHFQHSDTYSVTEKGSGDEVVFSIPKEGKYKGKVVILKGEEQIRPIDISITKNVFGLLISCTLLVTLFLVVANAYKKRGEKAPKGLQSLFEMLFVYVRDDIARKSIDEKHVDRYTPYLITVFFFIFINNLLGLIPFFPFGANITGNIAVTAVLAAFTFIITNVFGSKEYFKDVFNTPGVPVFLKLPIPLMPIIEFVGCLTKPLVLAIRLFANITAGHIVVLGFISMIFILGQMGAAWGAGASVLSLVFIIFVDVLELLVAYIQAYVFTLLSALYFGMACKEHHHG